MKKLPMIISKPLGLLAKSYFNSILIKKSLFMDLEHVYLTKEIKKIKKTKKLVTASL